MKHLFLLFSILLVGSFSLNAQTCNKSASAGKACCASKKTASVTTSGTDTKVASVVMEADAALEASNGNISKRTCEMSGTTAYFEKSVCSTSGKVSWDEVKFGAKVETKACCAGKSSGKGCCKKDGAKSCAGSKAGVN